LPRRTDIYADTEILELEDGVPPSRWKRAANRVAGVGVTVVDSRGEDDPRPPEQEPILRSAQNLRMDLAEEGGLGTFEEPKGSLAINEGPPRHASPPQTESPWQVLFGSPIVVALPYETVE
jgi:hypothetical protein